MTSKLHIEINALANGRNSLLPLVPSESQNNIKVDIERCVFSPKERKINGRLVASFGIPAASFASLHRSGIQAVGAATTYTQDDKSECNI